MARADGGTDVEKLTSVVERTYAEFDRERRLNDRVVQLMEEDLKAANDEVRRLGELRLSETLESTPNPVVLVSSSLAVQNINSSMLAVCGAFELVPKRGDTLAAILGTIAPGRDAKEIIDDLLAGEGASCRHPHAETDPPR